MISPGDVAPELMCWSLSFLSIQPLTDIEGSYTCCERIRKAFSIYT